MTGSPHKGGGFAGFPRDGVVFLGELERNNERDWFNARKKRFKDQLEIPAKHFADEMSAALGGLIKNPVKAKLFRIYRDVRFSKDKTPYNPFIRIGFGGGDDVPGTGHFYFSLEADKLILGGGEMAFSKSALSTFRDAVADDKTGRDLSAIVAETERLGLRMEPPELTHIPPGYDKEHIRGDLLRRKGLAAWRDLPISEDLFGANVVAFCLKHFSDTLPLVRWLQQLDKH